MAFKIFLDANCILDLTLHRTGFKDAQDIIQSGINGDFQLYTTPAVLQVTAYYTSQAYTKRQAKLVILTLLNDVQIIDCDYATALMAISSGIDDIEDALQYFTALKFNLEYFISSDKKLKKAAIPQLPVYSPIEFIAEMRHN